MFTSSGRFSVSGSGGRFRRWRRRRFVDISDSGSGGCGRCGTTTVRDHDAISPVKVWKIVGDQTPTRRENKDEVSGIWKLPGLDLEPTLPLGARRDRNSGGGQSGVLELASI